MHYLVTISALHDDREAVVIGGRVAKDVHDGPHFLYPVQTGDRGTHHLSVCGGGRGRGRERNENMEKGASEKNDI